MEYKIISAKVAQGGIRVDFEGGQWWFYNFRTKSFTRHRPGKFSTAGWGQKVQGPEQVDQFKSRGVLMERLGHCKPLIDALDQGMMQALAVAEGVT